MTSKYFYWEDKFSLNLSQIDKQHRHFIDLINDLYLKIEKGISKKEIINALESFKLHAIDHFKIEEEYFDRFNFSQKDKHKLLHQNYLRTIDTYILSIKKTSENTEKIVASLADYSFEWLCSHINKEDKEYIDLFVSQGAF